MAAGELPRPLELGRVGVRDRRQRADLRDQRILELDGIAVKVDRALVNGRVRALPLYEAEQCSSRGVDDREANLARRGLPDRARADGCARAGTCLTGERNW